jgi:hypothetical protein
VPPATGTVGQWWAGASEDFGETFSVSEPEVPLTQPLQDLRVTAATVRAPANASAIPMWHQMGLRISGHTHRGSDYDMTASHQKSMGYPRHLSPEAAGSNLLIPTISLRESPSLETESSYRMESSRTKGSVMASDELSMSCLESTDCSAPIERTLTWHDAKKIRHRA